MCIVSVRGQIIVSDNCNVTGGNSSGTGFGSNVGVNYQLPGRLSGSASNGLSYFELPTTTKAASSYSIQSNRIYVAVAANPGRFTLSSNGTSPFNFASALGTVTASAGNPVVYDLAAKISNHSPATDRTSFGIATADGGIQAWNLGIQLVNNGANLDIYRRVDSGSNPSGTDYNNVIATLAGQAEAEIDLRVRITDAGPETGTGTGNFNSSYQVFVNGNSVFTSAPGDFRFETSSARLILCDTAGNAGPVTYDALALTLVSGGTNTPPVSTNAPFRIVSHQLTPEGFLLAWSSAIGTNYCVLYCTNLVSPRWTLLTNITAGGTNTTVQASIDRTVESYFCVTQLARSGLSLTNVVATQRAGTGLVDIFYDLSDLYEGAASVTVLVSTDGGVTYHAAAASFSGDVGTGIIPGTGRHIVWNVGADWASVSNGNVRIKIVVDRSVAASDMALVPTGSFNMGDAMSEGLGSESPVHAVNLSGFYIGRYEVTKGLWDDVAQWATNHGYAFSSPAVAAATNLPVQQISWFDAVKWCNARSEKEGFPPAYFEDSSWSTVYRTGELNLNEANVRWFGAGYRLPTEAEWEKAARGGLSGKRFPWGNTITQNQADYWSTSFESFDVNGAEGPHPLAPQHPNTLPVGHFLPSGYGLYDMAGNSWEWCWDYYGDAWYSDSRASDDNTHGPSSASWGGDRVYRGGSGVDIAWKSRVANRADAPPRFAMGHFGFRVVLPIGENQVAQESSTFSLTP